MLVLSRKSNESITVDGPAEIIVLRVDSGRVKLGFRAPGTTKVLRTEVVKLERDSDANAH